MDKSKMRLIAISLVAFGLSSYVLSSSATISRHPELNIVNNNGNQFVPNGKGWGIQQYSAVNNKASTENLAVPQHGIQYHGGPVMGATNSTLPNVYYIWYGNWANNTGVNILSVLAKNIGASAYYKINTTYTNGAGVPIQAKVAFPLAGVNDNYSHGVSLSDSSIKAIVAGAINAHKLPLDSNGIYFVLTSSDVNATSGFCTKYCGWHTYGTINNVRVKYSFVGNPDRCPRSCEAQQVSPNNNPGADGMASVIAHELEETVTDPNLNAWYDVNGEENADKCAWTFGTTTLLPNGSRYNMTIGGFRYLIQRNWVNLNTGYCAKNL